MGRITSFSKQVIVFFLVTALIIRPTFAANVGVWTLSGGVAQGASTVYDATKNVLINGKKFIKESSVKITPPASQVAKVLARGAAGYALSVAVEQLLGAVDWVLDPANNQIKYNIPKESTCTASACNYQIDGIGIFASPSAACSAFFASANATGSYFIDNAMSNSPGYCLGKTKDGFTDVAIRVYQNVANPQEQEQKTLPLDVVAAQVISNAESDTDKRAAAQVATTAAAADIVAEAETDNTKARPIASQAEANATTKPADAAEAEKANEAQGEAKPNEANPEATDLSLTFPIFCNWAPTICEAAQTVISFPATLTEWWETANEWALSISEAWAKVKEEYANKPTENTDTQLDLPDQPEPNVNTDISFGGSCPASRSVPVSFAGIHTEIEFSFQWFCEVASIAKPVVISISAFAAALIVAGVRTEDD